jgi:hypothetical protein
MASTDNGVANTILQQLGGKPFATVTGAKNFLGDDKSLMFSLPSTRHFVKDGINKVRITLEPSDTYRIEFMKIGRRKGVFDVKTIKEINDIYCDMLQEVFSRYTGLTTRIF